MRKRFLAAQEMVVSVTRDSQWVCTARSVRWGEGGAVPGVVSCPGSAGPSGGRAARPPWGRPSGRRRPGRLVPAGGPPRGRRSPVLPGRRRWGGREPNRRGAGRPPSRAGGEALGVLGAQVVAVGFGVGGERAEDRGRVGVDVRQRRDGGTAAGGARTATYRAHDVGRYRTLERSATNLHQVTPPCRVVKRPTRSLSIAALTCADAGFGEIGRVRGRSHRCANRANCLEIAGLGEIRNRAQAWLEWSSCDMRYGLLRACPVTGRGRVRCGCRSPAGRRVRYEPGRRPGAVGAGAVGGVRPGVAGGRVLTFTSDGHPCDALFRRPPRPPSP